MKRQGVDKGVREGRIDGFRDPETGRLWVYDSYLDRAAGALDGELITRVESLEREIRELREALGRLQQEARDAEVTALKAKLASVTEANLQLLAAADLRDIAASKLKEAAELDRQASTRREEALDASRAAEKALREALSQEQLPGSPGDLG